MKNIFVEGIQGSGKSTLLRFIAGSCPQLQGMQEGDYSPVELAWCAYMNEREWEEALRRFPFLSDEIKKHTHREDNMLVVCYTKISTDHREFYNWMEQFEIYNGRVPFGRFREIIQRRYAAFHEDSCLFECAFLQNIVEDLILFHEKRDEEIMDFYRELYALMPQKKLLFFYLYSDDIAGNIRHAAGERQTPQGAWLDIVLEYFRTSPYGKRTGADTFDQLIAHFAHRQQLEMRILKEIVRDGVYLLPSKEWKKEDVLSCLEENK